MRAGTHARAGSRRGSLARAMTRLPGRALRPSGLTRTDATVASGRRYGRTVPARSEMSVVATVLNDREGTERLLEGLHRQRPGPADVVIVDGGSDDGTLEVLRRAERANPDSVRVVVAPGVNISAGRNLAVRCARGDWIACADAGCVPSEGWLRALEDALDEADFAGGVYVVDARTPFERALAVSLYPTVDEIGTSSRWIRAWQRIYGKAFAVEESTGRSMAFRRAAWEAVGGFPEDLYAGEDVLFVRSLLAAGCRLRLAPDAVVAWRPRSTWWGNARMYWLYARGDIRRGRRGRYVLRLAAWLFGLAGALRGSAPWRTAILVGGGSYVSLPLRRALRAGDPPTVWWRIPLVIALKDLSQLAGAAAGLLDAARGTGQPQPRATGR
jgi:glycosyltransferase involved in cell wall biosynthesis